MSVSPRAVFAAIVVACVGLVGFAMYLQHALGLEPCPMCILQRYAFIAIAAIALVAALHGPKGAVAKVYAIGLSVFAIAGAATSVRHSMLQRFPDESTSCVASDLGYLVNNFPLAQALPRIFGGTGECSKVHWKFLGLSIPEWALVWFVILAAVALVATFSRKR